MYALNQKDVFYDSDHFLVISESPQNHQL